MGIEVKCARVRAGRAYRVRGCEVGDAASTNTAAYKSCSSAGCELWQGASPVGSSCLTKRGRGEVGGYKYA